MADPAADFAPRVLAWWRAHGRKDLPWQRRPTPYRVWVSEIMLQQTQVTTAIPYYHRFMARFPSLRALARAAPDEVLALWSGLGYYARARNLHRAAQMVAERHAGRFPRDLDTVTSLPGIGRSTAAAILSLALGQRHAILDGNVKRLLARHAAVAGWPGDGAVQRRLWAESEARLPASDSAAYTQAVMDLGATVCTARAPACTRCPVAADCAARALGAIDRLPAPRPRRTVPERVVVFVLARDARGRVLLERRAPSGVWGGLWGLPECASTAEVPACLARLGLAADAPGQALAPVRHTFSHFRLHITPLLIAVREAGAGAVADCAEPRHPCSDGAGPVRVAGTVGRTDAAVERTGTYSQRVPAARAGPAGPEILGTDHGGRLRWVTPGRVPDLGLAAPVSRLLASLATRDEEAAA